uniref:FLamide neuropeptide n=1 Tax=Platynereis dumerilii TaxID=6359 RepID=F8UKT4_PLADU|nr:FLamide neuropeptide precursor [Platynereis dumerilii]
MSTPVEPCMLLALFVLLATGSSHSAQSANVGSDVASCDQERLTLCKACGTPDLLDKCCLDDTTYLICLKEVSKADAPYWEGELQDDDFEEDEKRAKYFLGKRAKYFLGKRPRNNFLGKRDSSLDFEDQYEGYDKRSPSPFLGKRGRSPFLGKRAKYFLGKRENEYDSAPMSDNYFEEGDKRAKYFLGKRAKYFLGKRASWEELLKRAKYFLGKRSEDKRQKYFLGKRSVDAVQQQEQQENSQ